MESALDQIGEPTDLDIAWRAHLGQQRNVAGRRLGRLQESSGRRGEI